MTISYTIPFITFLGDGVNFDFVFPFKMFSKEEMALYLITVATEEEELIDPSDYDVVFEEDGTGTVTYPNSGSAITSSYSVRIEQNVPYTQETEIRNQRNFFPAVIEDRFDRTVIQIQQALRATDTALTRTLRVPDGQTFPDLPDKLDLAGKLLGFDGEGNPQLFATAGDNAEISYNLKKATIAALRAATTATFIAGHCFVTSYLATAAYADGVAKGAAWYVLSSTELGADNGSTIIVDASARRWVLQHSGTVETAQAGCRCDGATDDLAAYNALLTLFNSASSGVSEIKLTRGTMVLSAEPSVITANKGAIRGYGSYSQMQFQAAAAATRFFRVGQASNKATYIVLEDFYVDASVNDTVIDGGKGAIDAANVTSLHINRVRINGGSQLLHLGGAVSGMDATTVRVNGCRWSPDMLANSYAIELASATDIIFDGCFISSGDGVATSRAIYFNPTNAAAGIDNVKFVNCTMNFNSAGIDNFCEVDCTQKGVSNVYFEAGCVLDGGNVSGFKFKLGAGQSATKTRRIHNFQIGDCRLFANTNAGSGGAGKSFEIDWQSDNLFSGFKVTGCQMAGTATLLETRGAGVSVDYLDATFTGNTIVNDGFSGGTLFSYQSNGVVIANNIVTHQDEDNALRFSKFVKLNSAEITRTIVVGNDARQCSSNTAIDTALVPAGVDVTGIIIDGNATVQPETWLSRKTVFSPEDFGAVSGGVVSSNTGLNAAFSSGCMIDGRGRTYGVTGLIALPASTRARDMVLKQLAASASQSVVTLSATSVNNLDLRRVKVDRNGSGANAGSNAFPNAALATSIGIHINGGTGHHLENLEVYGNDSGTGIQFTSLDRTSKIIRPYAHDMMAVVATASGTPNDVVQGISFSLCDNVHIEAPRSERLGWRNLIGDATTYVNCRGNVFSGNSSCDIFAPRAVDLGQGNDFTGNLGSGNVDCRVYSPFAKNCDTYGTKLANNNKRVYVFAPVSENCRFGGFVCQSGYNTAVTMADANKVVDPVCLDCGIATGTTGGILKTNNASWTYQVPLIVIRPVVNDRRGSPLMQYGLYSEFVDTATTWCEVHDPEVSNATDTLIRGFNVHDTREQVMQHQAGQPLVNSTAAQKIFSSSANGAFTVQAKTYYEGKMRLKLSSLAASGFFSIGFGGTASMTNFHADYVARKSDPTALGALESVTATSVAAKQVVTASANTDGYVRVTFRFRVNAGGTLIPQITLSVGAVGSVDANSECTIKRVGEPAMLTKGAVS